jgi:hypothetical protein
MVSHSLWFILPIVEVLRRSSVLVYPTVGLLSVQDTSTVPTRPGLPMGPLVLCRTPREICQSLINPRNRGRILYINPEPMALLCPASRRSYINRVWMVCGKLRGLRPCDNASKRKQEIDSFVYFPEATSCSATGRTCRIWNPTISYGVVQISDILLGVFKNKISWP